MAEKYLMCCEKCGQIFRGEDGERYCEPCKKVVEAAAAFKCKIRNAMIADLRCIRCNALFSGNYATAKYCPICREAVRKEYQQAYKHKTVRPMPEPELQKAEKYRGKPEPVESIAECAKNACKEGLSYGEYVARKYYGGGVRK